MLPRYAFTFCPSSVTSLTPCSARSATSVSTSSKRARYLLAARIRHDAEAAVFAAAFHDRDESCDAFHPGRRQVVELLDLGKADVDLRLAGCAARFDQLRQPVQRLRSEHQIDVGCARDDRCAFLARDAAADADQQIGIALLEMLDAPEIGEHFLLRLLAHRAGIEQDEVGLLGIVRRLQPFATAPARRPSCPSRTRSSGSRTS